MVGRVSAVAADSPDRASKLPAPAEPIATTRCPALWARVSLALTLGLLCVPGRAHAQTFLDFALQLEAPAAAGCSPRDALQREIEERVGHLVFLGQADPSRTLHVTIRAVAATSAWNARIEMHDARGALLGERQISVKTLECSGLDEALVVVISTLIGVADETSHAQAEKPAATQPKPQPSAPPAPQPTAAVPSTKHETSGSSTPVPLALALDVAARADVGLLPHLSPGPALALDLALGAFAFALSSAFLPSDRRDLGGGARASFSSGVLDLHACVNAAQGLGATLRFCVGAEAGLINVRTSGLATNEARHELFARGLFGARLLVPFAAEVSGLVDLAGAFPVSSPRFYFVEGGGSREYYHALRLAVFAQIGVCWVFLS